MPSDIHTRLATFEPVGLASDGAALDTGFADEFLRVVSRMAKAQAKTQQAVALSTEDVRQALAGQSALVDDLREQRRAAEAKNEQLARFLLDAMDVVFDFERAAHASGNAALIGAAETMERALQPKMERAGLSRISALGETPDALYHFVLSARPADTDAARDRIVDVVHNGYFLDGRILRKAEVIVSN